MNFFSVSFELSSYSLSRTRRCIKMKGNSTSDLNDQCAFMWGYEPTFLGSDMWVFRTFLVLELVSPENYPTIFDKLTVNTWLESIDEAERLMEPPSSLVREDSSFTYDISYSFERKFVKRYFVCQAKNMSDLLNGRTLEWYVKVWFWILTCDS